MIGPTSSRAPTSAASMRDLPRRTWRSTFSTTTIASSTTRPTDSTMARIVSRFRLKPKASITIAAPTSETGIATSGTSAVRIEPMNRNTTRPTIRIVSTSVLVISFSASRMNTVPSHTRRISMSSGSVGRMRSISSRRRLGDLDLVGADQRPDAEVDALLARCTWRPGRPPRRRARRAPRRARRTIAPSRSATIRSSNSLDRAQVGVRQQVDLHEVALGLADGGEVVVALRAPRARRRATRLSAARRSGSIQTRMAIWRPPSLLVTRCTPSSVASCGCTVREQPVGDRRRRCARSR